MLSDFENKAVICLARFLFYNQVVIDSSKFVSTNLNNLLNSLLFIKKNTVRIRFTSFLGWKSRKRFSRTVFTFPKMKFNTPLSQNSSLDFFHVKLILSPSLLSYHISIFMGQID